MAREAAPLSYLTESSGNSPLRIDRPGLIERVRRGEPVALIIAPPGFAKSDLAIRMDSLFSGAILSTAADWGRDLPTSESAILLFDNANELPGEAFARLVAWTHEFPDRRLVLFLTPPLPEALEPALVGVEHHRLRPDRVGFEPDETRRYLNQNMRGQVPEEIIDEAHDVTGGWPALLTFVTPENGDVEVLRSLLRRNDPPETVIEFVQNRLIPLLPVQDVRILGQLAVLRRFDKDLLQTVIGNAGVADAIHKAIIDLDFAVVRGNWTRLRAPFIREAFRVLGERASSQALIDANRRAAIYLVEHGGEVALPDVVAHFMLANEWEKALGFLEDHTDQLVERVSPDRLLTWLDTLAGHVGSLPFRATALHARVRAAAGDWSGAREALARCEQFLRTGATSNPADRNFGYARVGSVQAHIAWLRGRSSEANTYCLRALSALEQAVFDKTDSRADAVASMRFDLLSLRALLLLEAGKHEVAAEVLKDIAVHASESGRKRAEAQAFRDLGQISLRQGDVQTATRQFERAAFLVDRQVQPDLFGQIETSLARCFLLRGDFTTANTRVMNALSVRRRVGSLSGMAYTLLTLIQLRIAEERYEDAEREFREALNLIERSANLKLRAEVMTRYAAFVAERGRPALARELVERVRGFMGDLRRVEPSVAALSEVARASIASAEGRLPDAVTNLERARDGFSRLSTEFLQAYCCMLLAETHLRLGSSRVSNSRAPVRVYAEEACQIANGRGYDLGEHTRFAPVLDAAADLGATAVVQYQRRLRGEPFLDAPVRAERSKRRATVVMYRVLTPEGEQLLSRRDVDRVLSSMRRDTLTVVEMDGKCEIFHRGHIKSGELKRVVLPLLRTLLLRPGELVHAPSLAAAVWGDGDYDQRARTRLKVAVSRLRDLLGSDAKHLKTFPGTGPKRSNNTAYLLSTALSFTWVDMVEVEVDDDEDMIEM